MCQRRHEFSTGELRILVAKYSNPPFSKRTTSNGPFPHLPDCHSDCGRVQTLNIQTLRGKLGDLKDMVDAYAPTVLVLTEARRQHDNQVVNKISLIFPSYRFVQGRRPKTNVGGVCMLVHSSLFSGKISVHVDKLPSSTLILRVGSA